MMLNVLYELQELHSISQKQQNKSITDIADTFNLAESSSTTQVKNTLGTHDAIRYTLDMHDVIRHTLDSKNKNKTRED